jgi:plastocyanin
MHSFYTFVGLVLPAAVLAQYDYGGGGSTATTTAPASESTGNANVHTVQVGPGGRFVYDPEELTAAVGDKVEFFFHPLNHTVTKSTFDAPCVPTENNAIFSGFMPVAAGSEGVSLRFEDGFPRCWVVLTFLLLLLRLG